VFIGLSVRKKTPLSKRDGQPYSGIYILKLATCNFLKLVTSLWCPTHKTGELVN
jgi:hypothetical protein